MAITGPSIDQIAAMLAGNGWGVIRLSELETAAILNALKQSAGNRTRAAALPRLENRLTGAATDCQSCSGTGALPRV